MTNVVLDTNILVSSLLSSGPPAVIIDLVASGKIIAFYSDPILEEYQEVLSRKKFAFNPVNTTHLIHDIVRAGLAIESVLHKNNETDKSDQIFYNAAVEAKAYLITGNLRHFPAEPFIVSPAQFLAVYSEYPTDGT